MGKHDSDQDAERLLAGATAPDPDEPLTRFVGDLRAVFVAPASASTRAVHLQAMSATRDAARATVVPAPSPARAPRRRRRFIVRGAIAAGGLVLVGGSAMAATGTLPDAAQDAVSSVARHIGVKLPRAHQIEVDVDRVPLDVDRPVVKAEVTKNTAETDSGDRHRDSDDDSGSVTSFTEDRRSRRERRDSGTTTQIGGSPATPEPGSDDDDDDPSGGIDDNRGDPSGGGGDGSEPSDDGGIEPGDGGSDGGGSRGDPKDGSPSGADAEPGGSGPGDGGAGAGPGGLG